MTARRPDQAGGEGNPRTLAKRERTRRKLLDAARVVFERDGFHAARVADIVAEAGVATGTFYNYFESKPVVFGEVVKEVIADLREISIDDHPRDPMERIAAANRAYVEGYLRNARIMAIILQVGNEPSVRVQALEVRDGFESGISRAIRRWQQRGLVYADIDPLYTANALSYMVDRFLYEWTVLELDYDKDKVVETLNQIWARSLGLDGPRRQPRSRRPRKGS